MPERLEDPQLPKLLSLSVHEFRTPLTVVAGYVRMLLKERAGPLGDQQRRLLEETEKSCGRMTVLLNELSDLGRLEGGTLTFSRQPADLRAIVRSAVEQLPRLPDRDITVTVRTGDGPATIEADAPRLTSAIGSVVGALRRELVTSDELFVVERRLAGATPQHQIILGDRETVEGAMSEQTDFPAFDEWRGGCGLSLLVARRVLNAHGGGIWAPANQHKAGAVIMIPGTP